MSTALQVVYRFVAFNAAAVVYLAIALEWAIKELSRTMNVQHQALSGVPGVNQLHPKRQLFRVERVIEHLLHVHELGLVVVVGRVNSPIDNPVTLGYWIYIQAVDNTDSFNQSMRVTAVLQTHDFNFVRMFFVRDTNLYEGDVTVNTSTFRNLNITSRGHKASGAPPCVFEDHLEHHHIF